MARIRHTHWNFGRAASLAAKLAASLGVLWYAMRQVDVTTVSRDFGSIHPLWVAAGVAQLLLIVPLGGARWWVVLRALGSTMGMLTLTAFFWIGMAFNQVLPSASGGDAVRIVLAWRRGITLIQAAHSVILERVCVIVTLLALVVGLRALNPGRDDFPKMQYLTELALGLALVGLLGLVVLERFIPRHVSAKPLKAALRFALDARRSFAGPFGPRLVGLCVLTHVNLAVASLWLGNAFDLQLSWVDYMTLMPLVTLATMLPLSIGGWGIREGAIVFIFASRGVPGHAALAFSVLFGVCVAVISLPGLVAFWLAGRRDSELTGAPAIKEAAVDAVSVPGIWR